MAEKKETSVAAAEGNLPPPPKELPSFFMHQKGAFVPPVPPQLHPLSQPSLSPPVTATIPSSTPNPEAPTAITFPSVPSPLVAPKLPAVPPAAVPVPLPPSSAAKLSVSENLNVSKNTQHISSPADNEIVPTVPQAVAAPPPPQMMIPVNVPAAEEEVENDRRGIGMLQWFQQTVQQSEFLSKMANKAKSGVDTVLTTLDPGMRDFLDIDDGLHAVVLCSCSRIADAVKYGLRQTFSGIIFNEAATETNHQQIIGHDLAWKKAKERLFNLRSGDATRIHETIAVVVQPFLFKVVDCWFDTAFLLAQKGDVEVSVLTQATQVDAEVIAVLQKRTPKEYGNEIFATSVGYVYAELYGGDPEDWQQSLLSFSSLELYRAASIALGTNLKRILSMKSSKSS